MEVIEQINEFHNDRYSGYEIKTNTRTITAAIANYQSCCESWGYLMSQDDFSEFIGRKLIGVKVVDDKLQVYPFEQSHDQEDLTAMFVNFETDNGTLQFVAYNSHNGYYGHEVFLKSDDEILAKDVL